MYVAGDSADTTAENFFKKMLIRNKSFDFFSAKFGATVIVPLKLKSTF